MLARPLWLLRWSASRQWQWVEDYCCWLEDGCSPLQAAQAMRISAQQYGLAAEAQMAERLYQCLRSGRPMTSGLKGCLDNELLQVFALGQQSDCLTELLQCYRDFQRRRYQLLLSLWRQRLYPLFVLLLVLLATLMAGQSYLPKLLAYAPEPVQHWSIKVVLWLAELMMQWGVLLITATVAFMWLYRWLGRCWVSPWRWRLEQLGLFGYQRAMSAVWVTQMVALLLRHRLSLKDSLRRLQPLSNRYAGYHLQRMAKRLARGEQHLSQVMSTGLLTPELLFRLHNGGRSGAVIDGLWQTALRCDQSIRRQLLRRQWLTLAVVYVAIVALLLLLLQAGGQAMMALLQ